MTQERIKHNSIEIERNPIERFLMKVKQFLLENRQWVIISLIGLAAVIVISIVSFVLVEHHINKQKTYYGEILMLYAMGNPEDINHVNIAVDELKNLVNSSYFGMTTEMPYFIIGDILYPVKQYKESAENLIKYANMSSSKILASLALQKAAIALEEAGDLDGALVQYKKLLGRYSTSPTYDAFLYNAARVYAMKGDDVNANKYFDEVKANYSQSIFAERARKLQLLLNAGDFPKGDLIKSE
jgi:tetratricopeptide (TPR) repeat protein